MKALLFLLVLFSFNQKVHSKEPRYIIKEREHIPTDERMKNFGIAYGVQFAYYFVSQEEVIREHGSFKNWQQNFLSPHFDKDSFDYNIFQHSVAGSIYYLWYRSRSYTESDALLWTFLSSLAFEFSMETITERPSWQDIYQTPVFGTALGFGVEKMTLWFHSWDNWIGHGLGYLFNPFTMIPRKKDEEISFTPYTDGKTTGAYVLYRF